jgi:hypothetical protein
MFKHAQNIIAAELETRHFSAFSMFSEATGSKLANGSFEATFATQRRVLSRLEFACLENRSTRARSIWGNSDACTFVWCLRFAL